MYLQPSNPVGATIGFDTIGFFGFAFGTIYDDDITEVPPPELRVGRASVVEGGDGDTERSTSRWCSIGRPPRRSPSTSSRSTTAPRSPTATTTPSR